VGGGGGREGEGGGVSHATGGGKVVHGGGGRRSRRRGHAVEGGDYGADPWAPTHSEGRWSNGFESNSKIQMVYFNSKSFQTLTDSKRIFPSLNF
jgi:hypothetical protein